MGVTIHYALGMKSARVQRTLDRTQALAEQIKREQVAPLSVPFAIRRPSPTKLLIDIEGCETLVFDLNSYESYGKYSDVYDGLSSWSYEQSVLRRVFNLQVLQSEADEHYKRFPEQRPLWAGAFCKTQYAVSLAAHRWVAELIRSVASVADYAHVYDEGDYYHTLEIEDAAEAIHENGLLISSLGNALGNALGEGIEIVRGGETKIKPSRRSSSDITK